MSQTGTCLKLRVSSGPVVGGQNGADRPFPGNSCMNGRVKKRVQAQLQVLGDGSAPKSGKTVQHQKTRNKEKKRKKMKTLPSQGYFDVNL